MPLPWAAAWLIGLQRSLRDERLLLELQAGFTAIKSWSVSTCQEARFQEPGFDYGANTIYLSGGNLSGGISLRWWLMSR
jgi:hypothetical protein